MGDRGARAGAGLAAAVVCALLMVVCGAGTAAAAGADAGPQSARLAAALRTDPVYVSDQLPREVPRSSEPAFAALAKRTGVPTYVLVLPDQSAAQDALLGTVHDRLGRDGLYVLVDTPRHRRRPGLRRHRPGRGRADDRALLAALRRRTAARLPGVHRRHRLGARAGGPARGRPGEEVRRHRPRGPRLLHRRHRPRQPVLPDRRPGRRSAAGRAAHRPVRARRRQEADRKGPQGAHQEPGRLPEDCPRRPRRSSSRWPRSWSCRRSSTRRWTAPRPRRRTPT